MTISRQSGAGTGASSRCCPPSLCGSCLPRISRDVPLHRRFRLRRGGAPDDRQRRPAVEHSHRSRDRCVASRSIRGPAHRNGPARVQATLDQDRAGSRGTIDLRPRRDSSAGISHDPAAGTAALETLTNPVISTTCTRVPGLRFPDPRVQALLAACCALALRPAGFTSRDLRHLLAPQLGKDPEDMTGGQISYDLRRLRAHQIIERIPHSRTYQLTADGLSTALFFTRLTRRVIIPGLAEIAGTGPPPGSPLRQADRAYKTAIADLASQASLGTQPRPSPKHHSCQAPVVTRNPS